jgi:tryptophan-rich sensory protein
MKTIKKLFTKEGFLSLFLVYSLCLGASYWTHRSIGPWYYVLNKSPYNPPPIVFMVVWPVLYTFMGLALGTLWSIKKALKFKALVLFFLQLGFNLLWPYIFFKQREISFAFMLLLALWATLTFTQVFYFFNARRAFWLLTPYWLWINFALYLNYFIFMHN